ncbi:hypothetical protein EV140_1674 [Microcella alkaliphila]|uniref:Uncharacterized protein n=2 Tax=Microcella alkaliphila TaxID=279828 RepID=A0A4Q7TJB5_9MICO|nr:hypothetical protein EV140_1674 [Microcella alkaliphila]
MLAVAPARHPPGMNSPDPFLAADLRARERQLAHAADIVRTAPTQLPGPESRAGFAGPIRVVYDAEARRIEALLAEADGALTNAWRHFTALASAAESGSGR